MINPTLLAKATKVANDVHTTLTVRRGVRKLFNKELVALEEGLKPIRKAARVARRKLKAPDAAARWEREADGLKARADLIWMTEDRRARRTSVKTLMTEVDDLRERVHRELAELSKS